VLSFCVAGGVVWLAAFGLTAILGFDRYEKWPYNFIVTVLLISVLLFSWVVAFAWFEGVWEFVLPFRLRSRI
jgi:hypothetical protein